MVIMSLPCFANGQSTQEHVQVEHPWHLSLAKFMLNLLVSLMAYSLQSIYHNDVPILQSFTQICFIRRTT